MFEDRRRPAIRQSIGLPVIPPEHGHRERKARSGPTIDDRPTRRVRSNECVRFGYRRANDPSGHPHGSSKIDARFRTGERPSRERQTVERVDHHEMATNTARRQHRTRQDVGSGRGDKSIRRWQVLPTGHNRQRDGWKQREVGMRGGRAKMRRVCRQAKGDETKTNHSRLRDGRRERFRLPESQQVSRVGVFGFRIRVIEFGIPSKYDDVARG